MKKCKGISLMLAAMLLAQSCVVPAMASDTDTYPQEDGYYVETAPEDEVVPEEEDPQYWAEAHRGEIQNSQLAAYGVDHSWFTPRPLKDGETLRKGVDISQFQGNIDWATVKKNGIEFAFIRVGYRGWAPAVWPRTSWCTRISRGPLIMVFRWAFISTPRPLPWPRQRRRPNLYSAGFGIIP